MLHGLPEPVPSGSLVRGGEVLQLRVDEMVCNLRHDISNSAVRNDRNFLDFPMMFLDEVQMGEQRVEILPARERFCVYQYSTQRTMSLQISIDAVSYFFEICRFKRSFKIYHKYLVSQFVVYHWTFPILYASPSDEPAFRIPVQEQLPPGEGVSGKANTADSSMACLRQKAAPNHFPYCSHRRI